jgi:hypothetical protein
VCGFLCGILGDIQMATLTEDKIRRLKWDHSKRTRSGNIPKHQIHNDPDVKGHHVRLYPPKGNGKSGKLFYLAYGASMNRKFYRIGCWGDWTLEDARAEARKARKAFYGFGIDPTKARKKRTEEAKERLTVKLLTEKYIEDHAPSVWSVSTFPSTAATSSNWGPRTARVERQLREQ